MKVVKYNVVNPKKYQSGNEEKTYWANVGTMTEFHKDDGNISRILELNFLDKQFMLYPSEPKTAPSETIEYPNEETSEDAPF